MSEHVHDWHAFDGDPPGNAWCTRCLMTEAEAAAKQAAVDRATALSQARTKVVEAAKRWRLGVQRLGPLGPAVLLLAAAVDALEEVERRG